MAIMGLRHTENFVVDERPKNWRAGILLRYPSGNTPLTGLTAAMSEESTDDPEYKWWEKDLDDRRLQLGANLSGVASGTAENLTVSGKAQTLKKGDLLYAEATGEIMFVTADPISSTTVPTLRGFAGSTAASLTIASVDPFLKVIGSAYEEASQAPTGINFDPVNFYNYTQIFRNSLEMSNTARQTKLRTGDQVKEAKRECAEYHGLDMEMAFWFGRRSQQTLNGKPQRTTDGIFAVIPSDNVVNQDGDPLDMETMENWFEIIFRRGSNEKMAFCGNRALLAINQAIRKNSQWNIQTGIKEYGMRVTRLISPFGELVLKTHPLWNQMGSNLTAGALPVFYGLDTWLCVLDMSHIRYRYLQGRDTKYEPDNAENGLDGLKSGYITECGLEVRYRASHHLFKGLVTGAADT